MIISDKENFIELSNNFIKIDGNWMEIRLPYDWFIHSQTCSVCNSLNDKIKNESNKNWYLFTSDWYELEFLNTKYDTDIILEGDDFYSLYVDNIKILEIDSDTKGEIIKSKIADDRDGKLHSLLGCTSSSFKSNSFIPMPMFRQISEEEAQRVISEMKSYPGFIELESVDMKIKTEIKIKK